MVDRIVAEVPTYRRASPDVIDDVLVLSTLTPNRPKPSISGQNPEQPEAAASHGAESSRPAS
jgi:hypothetical protein